MYWLITCSYNKNKIELFRHYKCCQEIMKNIRVKKRSIELQLRYIKLNSLQMQFSFKLSWLLAYYSSEKKLLLLRVYRQMCKFGRSKTSRFNKVSTEASIRMSANSLLSISPSFSQLGVDNREKFLTCRRNCAFNYPVSSAYFSSVSCIAKFCCFSSCSGVGFVLWPRFVSKGITRRFIFIVLWSGLFGSKIHRIWVSWGGFCSCDVVIERVF